MDGYKLYHMDDSGRKVDLSDKQKELADQAKDRSAEKIAKAREDDPGMTDDEYMLEEYADDHDEYLVDGARLKCSHAIREIKVIQGKIYRSVAPDTTTVLKVTENPKAKCCGYLYHATVKDRKVKDNIPPFRCNCDREPHNEKEWAKLEADETCLYEGTCKALIDLEDEWDNLPTMTPYLSFGNDGDEELISGITMSSVLFCRHGGFITPLTSGQRMGSLFDSINSVSYKTGEQWTAEMIEMAKYVTSKMLMEGYSLEIIAGFVGNIVNEGKFGHFESSDYKTRKKPSYLIHMDDVHNYGTYVSGKDLSDIGTYVLVQFRKDGNCLDQKHGFGFGTVQWTYNRCEALIDRYLDKFGDNAFPTKEECAEVEIDYMLEELSTTYKDVIEKCERETIGMSDIQSVAKNTEIIMTDYERAGVQNLSERQEAADIWYRILIGESDGA